MRKVQEELRERIRALPGMERLLPALDGLPPVYLVGGAVRDLLLGQPVVDVDLAVEGDGPRTAARAGGPARRRRARRTSGSARRRFAPARSDSTSPRRGSETYPEPGALPVVEPAGLSEDLGRRDFAINAMAAALQGDELGHLHDPHGGSADLDARVVRVLHDRSFIDDPTRLLRAVRYEVRLDFRMDEADRGAGARGGAPRGARHRSGPRIRDELLDLLGEHAAPRGVARLVELGLLETLGGDLNGDPELVASAKLGAGETGADPALTALAALASPEPDAAWVESLGLRADERDAVLRAARKAPQLAKTVRADLPDSAIHALLHCEHPETLALTLALRRARAARSCATWPTSRACGSRSPGDDLVEAGVPESPALGRALEETLRKKLDGELEGRDEELRYALEVARSDELIRAEPARRRGGVLDAPRRRQRGARTSRSTSGILTDDDRDARRAQPRAARGRGRHRRALDRDGLAGARHRRQGCRDDADRTASSTKVDGHVTARDDLALLVLVADCLPVALAGGDRVAMVHCGWRGLAGGILASAVAALRRAAGRGGRPGHRRAAATRSATRCRSQFDDSLRRRAHARPARGRGRPPARRRRRADRARRPLHELPRATSSSRTGATAA